MKPFRRGAIRPPVALFLLCFAILAYTTAPAILNTDSPELVAAAHALGIPHAPGYPLYTLTAHAFTRLPFDDPAYAVNLYSALALSLATVFLYEALRRLLDDVALALAASLIFVWSYFAWTSGIVAEVYAPQAMLLAACGLALSEVYHGARGGWVVAVGGLFGLAVGMVPSSIVFAPGMALAFLLLDIPWRGRVLAGGIAIVVFLLTLVYFPLVFAVTEGSPALNSAGEYDAAGVFQAVDLGTADGVWWLISGAQFEHLFFADGPLPSLEHLVETGGWFAENTLGFGVLLALVGLVQMRRGLLAVWLLWFVPYVYFFAGYGAPDRETMFVPAHLLMSVPILFGLKWASDEFSGAGRYALLAALPMALLVFNFPRVNAHGFTDLRDHVEGVAAGLPADAYVFGSWEDTMPLKYLQVVDEARPDVMVYPVFFFDNDGARIRRYVDALLADGARVVFFDEAAERFLPADTYARTVVYQDADTPFDRAVTAFDVRRP